MSELFFGFGKDQGKTLASKVIQVLWFVSMQGKFGPGSFLMLENIYYVSMAKHTWKWQEMSMYC